ncbi:MAG TPA: ABC transporter permease [Bdellovibrionota bacterium]|jgi:oligopeptide transport system permease protein|nr:ABC transporter permease [Bdellovibrionota bacterium]
MLRYALRRSIDAAVTLALLVAMTFFLLRLAPGGPFDGEKAWPPAVKANIDKHYGLDQPLPKQFVHWMGDLIRLDLNESFHYEGLPVRQIIAEALPPSAWVGFWALLLSVGIGLPLGALAAWKRNTWVDFSATFAAISGVSLPTYLVASLLVLVFSLKLGWLPPALWEGPSSAILPALSLALRPLCLIARLTRSTMLEAMASDYVRTAMAKGLSDPVVVFKHALRNSLIPVVTLLGPMTASLVTGSFVVEVVFQIPGVGKHFVTAVLNRDYPLVMGTTLLYGLILVSCNLAVDLAYAWVDPRIRLEG